MRIDETKVVEETGYMRTYYFADFSEDWSGCWIPEKEKINIDSSGRIEGSYPNRIEYTEEGKYYRQTSLAM